MREPKPAWDSVPPELRSAIEKIIGGAVTRAGIVWGGFGPSATFALTRADGTMFFCKGTHPGQTRQGHEALLHERRNYERFPELTAFSPRYLGGADRGDWHMAVLESVARTQDVPPWFDETTLRAIKFIADFHAASPERAVQDLDTIRDFSGPMYGGDGWKAVITPGSTQDGFVALFEQPDAARDWLARHGKGFASLTREVGGPASWLHLDIRSDNLLFAAERLYLVDWPLLAFGPALLDIAFFLPSLAGEGGPSCAEGLKLYERARGIAFAVDDIAAAAAMVAGFFAARAGEPPIPGLPRLRWIQKLQLFPALDWLSACLAIERPPLPRPFAA
jgi:hypothetical protein